MCHSTEGVKTVQTLAITMTIESDYREWQEYHKEERDEEEGVRERNHSSHSPQLSPQQSGILITQVVVTPGPLPDHHQCLTTTPTIARLNQIYYELLAPHLQKVLCRYS